jgi:hypothetical protein
MVLEQRIGRIHRIGTINTVIVHTILLENSREADIYSRLIDRLNTIVGALVQDPEVRTQYFRRILAGIPLETLRALFSGQRGDDDAISAAVEAGKEAVDLVDSELRQHRVHLTGDERGRATMEKLVQLLELGNKIQRINQGVEYTRIKFDPGSEQFIVEEVRCPCYRINHGRSNAGVDWIVFDREAAAKSSQVNRERTGGINHPLIALALRTLRTPTDAGAFHSLAIGMGTYDLKSPLRVFADGKVEPIVIFTYLTAYSNGGHFFNHRLRVYAFSPGQGDSLDISSEGELVQNIFWSQLGKDHSSRTLSDLTPIYRENVGAQDRMLRLALEAELKDEAGNWVGAIWPIAISLLLPE